MTINREPPAALVAKVTAINEELAKGSKASSKLHLEIYLADDEWGDEWKILLSSRRPEFVLKNLTEDYLHWHLMYLIAGLAEGMYTAGTEHGLEVANKRVSDFLASLINRTPLPKVWSDTMLTRG
jgi:hypothetical protein